MRVGGEIMPILCSERLEMVKEIAKLAKERADTIIECTQNIIKKGSDFDKHHILNQFDIILEKDKKLYKYLESLSYDDLLLIDKLIDLGGGGSLNLENKNYATIVALIADIEPLDVYLKKGVEKLLVR
jgi:hypothetical protein